MLHLEVGALMSRHKAIPSILVIETWKMSSAWDANDAFLLKKMEKASHEEWTFFEPC